MLIHMHFGYNMATDSWNGRQADTGAQVVQIFDSWASELSPQDFDVFSAPYIKQIIDTVRKSHPDLAIILYISGSGGLLERMAIPEPDVISVDQRVGMQDAIRRIGPKFAVQVSYAALHSCQRQSPRVICMMTYSTVILAGSFCSSSFHF